MCSGIADGCLTELVVDRSVYRLTFLVELQCGVPVHAGFFVRGVHDDDGDASNMWDEVG